ncbi:MAG: exopolyphosphatase [Planctomycetes bacterium]|nr:exopolyphosphatase [Planctomycetota bacterium]
MRILTRGDLDGLTGSVLITLVEKVTEIRFAHPKDVQDGLVPVTEEDIIVNLPYVKGCGMWFDHHVSEEHKKAEIGEFKGAFELAPSAARVVANYYKSPAFTPFETLLDATDRLDSAQLTVDEVSNPDGWILLGYTLDPRTGLGPEFQKYFRWLVEYVKEVPLEKILQHPEVKKRCDRVLEEQAEFTALIRKRARLDGNVIVTDLRGVPGVPAGNRFVVFTLYPAGNVEVRIFGGKGGKVIVAAGHSIFNRTCRVNIGELMARYGGGGHQGAGTCQLPMEEAEASIAEIIDRLRSNLPGDTRKIGEVF